MHEVKDGKLTFSTGVVLKIKEVPAWGFVEIKKQMRPERPKVPIVHIEEKGRDEENPSDPDYIEATEAYNTKLTERLIDMIIILGTEFDSAEDGFPLPEEDSWAQKLTMVGLTVPEKTEKGERYLAWVKLCAAPSNEDFVSLLVACGRGAGVTEEDVAESMASFRDTEKRGADRNTGS